MLRFECKDHVFQQHFFFSVARYDDDAEMKSDDDSNDKKEDGPPREEGTDKPDGDQEEEEPVQETRIDVEVPKISTDLGQEVNFIKLPNFLSVDCRPFDPETYEDEIDDDDVLDEEGNSKIFTNRAFVRLL